LLRDQGFEEVLLLLGYLAPAVQDYVGDGRQFGITVRSSVTPPEYTTLRRLRAAREQIDDTFLLLCCDNYWPMRFDDLWQRYRELNAPAMITVYANKDGYSTDNVRIAADGFVETYDSLGLAQGLKGVEIGYAILRKDLLEAPPVVDAPIEQALYPMLAQRHELGAYMTEHRYYGVGTPRRLAHAKVFFAGRPAVILDRDGVLNRRPAPGEYVCGPLQFKWLPGALEALRRLKDAGYTVIVASDHSGMARGHLDVQALEGIHEMMRCQARAAGGRIDAVYHCPHDERAGCECRRPKPGLLLAAQRDFSLDLTRTHFFGDDPRDLQAATAAGAPAVLVSTEHSLLSRIDDLLGGQTPAHN